MKRLEGPGALSMKPVVGALSGCRGGGMLGSLGVLEGGSPVDLPPVMPSTLPTHPSKRGNGNRRAALVKTFDSVLLGNFINTTSG
jgi:hypothetical protein